MRRTAAALLTLGLLAGCGGGEEEKGPPDAQGVREVVRQYLDAVAAKDWAAACETRVLDEREPVGASCADTLRSLLGAADTSAYAEAEIGEPEIVGERADIAFIVPGQDLAQRLSAVVEDGEWRLEDSGY